MTIGLTLFKTVSVSREVNLPSGTIGVAHVVYGGLFLQPNIDYIYECETLILASDLELGCEIGMLININELAKTSLGRELF